MSSTSHKANPSDWQPGRLVDWVATEGRFLTELDAFVQQLGDRLVSQGASLWRLRLTMRTLHPLVAAISSVWERDAEEIEHHEALHGLEGRAGVAGSPLSTIAQTGKPFRKRLEADLSDTDHAVLHELRARGGSDYFGVPLLFSEGTPGILVFATDRKGGFSDPDIDGFSEIAVPLTPIVELYRSRLISRAVAEAYLGPRTGRRVLEGQITRGNVEKINAAILMSDIRDWTGLNNRVAGEDALAMANRYFEVVAEAVERNGGEILKFMGDGVLAIFPTDQDTPAPDAVCQRALAAARQALSLAEESEPPLDLSFGIGMHYGEVLYGNIGSKTRIDFTVLGQAVNTAARIEGLCDKLDRPVLFSEQFAERLAEPAILVAEELLKGHDTPLKIFSI